MARTSWLHRGGLYGVVLVCLCLVPLSFANDWRYEETHSDSREFVSGGYVHVRFSVGDIHVRRGDSAKIKLQYTVKSRRESNVKDAHVDFDVKGNDASIEFHAPSSNTEFDVELEVPANTNIDVHEKVGDMTIDNIEGNKDLDLGVGDIRVVAPAQSMYKLVSASTGIGDVDSDGYGETNGWLGKTLKYRGDGKYELRARVGVGDIRLEGK
jgi:hypothetical protein